MPIQRRSHSLAMRVCLNAKRSKNKALDWRLLALAAIYDGASLTEALAIGSVTVARWVGLGGEVQRT